MLKRSCALALLIMSSSAPALAQTEPAAAAPLATAATPGPAPGVASTAGANPFKRSTLSTLPPPPPVTGAGQASGTAPGDTSGTGPPPLYYPSETPAAPSKGRRVGKVGDELIYRKEGIYSFEAETLPGGLMPAPMLPGSGTVIAPVVATVVAVPGTVVQGSAGPQPLPQPAPGDLNANGRFNVDPSGPKPVVPQ